MAGPNQESKGFMDCGHRQQVSPPSHGPPDLKSDALIHKNLHNNENQSSEKDSFAHIDERVWIHYLEPPGSRTFNFAQLAIDRQDV